MGMMTALKEALLHFWLTCDLSRESKEWAQHHSSFCKPV